MCQSQKHVTHFETFLTAFIRSYCPFSSEISLFSQVPAFIVNALLITLSKLFKGQKYTVIKKRYEHICKIVNSQELYRFLSCSRKKDKCFVRCLQQDFGSHLNVLIDVMEYLVAGGRVVNSANVDKGITTFAIIINLKFYI